MKFMRVKAVIRKEFIQIFRDYRSLWMALAIPVILLGLFGYALTLDVDYVPLVIWDQEQSYLSRDFILNFNNSRYFQITGYYDNYPAMEERINTNRALMAMIIPPDFSYRLESGQTAPVQLLVDGSDSNTASIALGYAEAITGRYNARFIRDRYRRYGRSFNDPLQLRPRVWFNETLQSRNFIIPGLVAVIMMIIAALLTSLTVAKEWERGTMEQLISTPVKSGELILGKFIPYFVIGMIDMLIVVIMGQYIFHVPLRGNPVELFILAGIFLTGMLCWGILISVLTRNQFIASQISFITTFLPAFILSGFTFPIGNMPRPIQMITMIIPVRYFVSILKGIYLKGVGLEVLWPHALFLLVFAGVMIMLATKKFKKRVA
ncbi:MAG: ABC transporter permease [Candidatus Omnitrophica bacterium]|nr:ABC transporter permease [Candidatus Omnitrophota bacterium]